ncbi:PTS sugar transporter subunit IIA [Paucilactobacillus suebicus]|uniref:PTS sugar transporter subunit IIA n=1 Tax=Paucilactobacillus suebicus TaxID=152335 RepID=UPI0002490337|nr:PTS sugar transporter subunit IIA [Paucilactobacillus suebicus]
MLSDLLTSSTIQVSSLDNLTWKQAIEISAQPLIDNGSIEPSYVESMKKVVNEKGPYFNIGPHIALSHARPEAGANKISLALLKTDKEVNLVSKDHPIQLWFVLAATDSQSHLKVIQELMELLMDETKVTKMCEAKNVQELQNIIKTN